MIYYYILILSLTDTKWPSANGISNTYRLKWIDEVNPHLRLDCLLVFCVIGHFWPNVYNFIQACVRARARVCVCSLKTVYFMWFSLFSYSSITKYLSNSLSIFLLLFKQIADSSTIWTKRLICVVNTTLKAQWKITRDDG